MGTTAYFSGSETLEIMGVVPAVATAGHNATGWFSDPVSAAGVQIFIDNTSVSVQLNTLALTNPRVESTTGGEVKVVGGFPAAPGVPPSLVGNPTTLTVSRTAPYYPIQLSFGSAADEDFADWGAVPPLKRPSASTPLSSILKPSSDQAILSRIAVAKSEVPSGFSVGVVPGGEEVTDQITLDYCSSSPYA